jgi:hypothetical protein
MGLFLGARGTSLSPRDFFPPGDFRGNQTTQKHSDNRHFGDSQKMTKSKKAEIGRKNQTAEVCVLVRAARLGVVTNGTEKKISGCSRPALMRW